jgi:hypothetical protein
MQRFGNRIYSLPQAWGRLLKKYWAVNKVQKLNNPNLLGDI